MPTARRSGATTSLSTVAAACVGWHDAVAELMELQADYQTWLDTLPENLADTATADRLRMICELDLSELASAEPPRGFGRD
jgi:hypothetical protein